MTTKPITKGKAFAGAALIALLGTPVALALVHAIPKEESGRTVQVTVTKENDIAILPISGHQFLNVYLDVAGYATACDGLRFDANGKPVKLGQHYTEAQCSVMLLNALLSHAQRVMACSPGLALSPDQEIELRRQGPRFAAVSVGYNIGTQNYCGSTARARFNAENYPGGCVALTWWNKAGGKVNRGVDARRKREENVCLKGLSVLK